MGLKEQSPTILKNQIQRKEDEKQKIIEKVELEHIQPTDEEQKIASEVIRKISDLYSEDLIHKDIEELETPIRNSIAEECSFLELPFEQQKRVEKIVSMMILGNGPIEEFLQDPEVSEIVVQRFDNIVVEKHGLVEPVSVVFNQVVDGDPFISWLCKQLFYCSNSGAVTDPLCNLEKPFHHKGYFCFFSILSLHEKDWEY